MKRLPDQKKEEKFRNFYFIAAVHPAVLMYQSIFPTIFQFFEHLDNMYGKEAVRFRLEVEEENERAVKAYKKAGFERLGYVQMAKDY